MTVQDASRALRIALVDVRTPMVPSSTREPTASSRTGSRYLRLLADSTFLSHSIVYSSGASQR